MNAILQTLAMAMGMYPAREAVAPGVQDSRGHSPENFVRKESSSAHH